MKVQLVNGKSPIGETIRAVAVAQSSRLFKSEHNTEQRSAFVFLAIRSEITLALFDLGLSVEKIIVDIDPTDDILAAMLLDGYKLSTRALAFGPEVTLVEGGGNA